MNINELNKQQKISLLKALAAGKITKQELSDIKQLDALFVEFQNHNPVEYSIAGERVDEQEFRKRLDISNSIMGDEVVHIVIIHKSKHEQSNAA
ncbi:MAG: hypothetical protein ACK50E_03460 [Bacteroidota bacterium]|jgi:hypothetical protein